MAAAPPSIHITTTQLQQQQHMAAACHQLWQAPAAAARAAPAP